MAIRDKHGIFWITALFLAFVLVLGVLHGCRKEPAEETGSASPNDVAAAAVAADSSPGALQTAVNLLREPKASIQNIVKEAQTWDPSFENWWGTPAPDFTVTDVDGKTHKLSDHRGKEIMVVIWTTWCPTCKLEIPHLKELRGAFSNNELAILAVSNEAPALLKSFVQEQGLNYTVLSNQGSLPAPFGDAKYIPTSFFVDAEGKFKVAGVGMMPVEDSKRIVQAK